MHAAVYNRDNMVPRVLENIEKDFCSHGKSMENRKKLLYGGKIRDD